MTWLVILLVGLLSGCARLVQKERKALDAAVSTVINDDEFCQNSGANPGTPSYLDCREKLARQREAATSTIGR
jgi:hypothetical protein